MKNFKSIDAFAQENKKLENETMKNIDGGGNGTMELVRDSDTMIDGGADCREVWAQDGGGFGHITIH